MVVATSARSPLKQALPLCCHWGLWGFGSCDKSSATTCARSKPEYAHITFFKRPPIFLAHPNVLPKKEPIFLIGRFAGFFFLIFPSSIFMHFSLPRCCHWRPRPQVVSIAMASWFQICRQQTWAFFLDENKRVASMVLVDYWCLETPHLRGEPGLAAEKRGVCSWFSLRSWQVGSTRNSKRLRSTSRGV